MREQAVPLTTWVIPTSTVWFRDFASTQALNHSFGKNNHVHVPETTFVIRKIRKDVSWKDEEQMSAIWWDICASETTKTKFRENGSVWRGGIDAYEYQPGQPECNPHSIWMFPKIVVPPNHPF